MGCRFGVLLQKVYLCVTFTMNMKETEELKKGITVYCGSSVGRNPKYAECARIVGREIARHALPLIYGGGHMGLMGEVGRAVRASGGCAIAIIPQFMVERGWNDTDASVTVVTPSMHVRKETMAARALGIIALPGGIGTFEELCEIITWRQLGLFNGNIVILNVDGYYDPWLAQFEAAVREGFLPPSHRSLFHVADDPAKSVSLAAGNSDSEPIAPKF